MHGLGCSHRNLSCENILLLLLLILLIIIFSLLIKECFNLIILVLELEHALHISLLLMHLLLLIHHHDIL
jgi:hypothetical protein